MDAPEPILSVAFFRTETGREPVREWLKSLPRGMPLVRKLDKGLWEVRVRLTDGIARILFTTGERRMVLLHGFIKKSQKTPREDLELAKTRLRMLL
jgi:phage-related protein